MRTPIFILKIPLLLYLVLFCCFDIRGIAQAPSKIDSLLTAAQKERHLPSKINLYFSIATYYRNTNADSAIIFNRIALKHAITMQHDSSIAQGYYNIAATEATRNNYEIALINFDSA